LGGANRTLAKFFLDLIEKLYLACEIINFNSLFPCRQRPSENLKSSSISYLAFASFIFVTLNENGIIPGQQELCSINDFCRYILMKACSITILFTLNFNL